MKLVKKIRLAFREGKSDKVYEVDLVELSIGADARFLVNFRYGRRGSTLREGTKTPNPVTLAEGEATYDSVVVSKINGGYWDEAGPAPARPPAAVVVDHAANRSTQDARHTALLKALAGTSHSKTRARIIWNLGQCAPRDGDLTAVIANMNRGDWLEDYSIAWTLGRWRDDAAIAPLEKLQRHSNPTVSGIALEALLLASSPSAAANLLHAERAALPAALLTAVAANNEDEIVRTLQGLATAPPPELNQALVTCYRLALFAAPLHRAVLTFLDGCAFAPGVFKAVRHIFKTAELRLDAPVFACLAHRFDTTKPFFRHHWDRIFIPQQGSIVVSKELARDTPRLAYSNRTRDYMRKRSWRTLLRLGRADSDSYVTLAKSVLLRVSDGDAVEPRKRDVFRWDAEGRRRKHATHEYGPYAHLLTFNHILFGADPTYRLSASGAAWYRSSKPGTPARHERYAHLWDQAPAAALDLLKFSRCSIVHDAAIRMLAGQTQFLNALGAGEIAQLIVSGYSQTSQFALPLARALFERAAGDEQLLQSPLQQAREFGVEVLTAQPNWLADAALLIELLLIFATPIPEIVDAALATAGNPAAETQQQVVNGVIVQLAHRNLAMTREAAETLARLLSTHFRAAVAALPLTLLDRLLAFPDIGRQVLGARLLVANNVAFKEIPERLLQHIHGSAHEETRAIAIALLTKQSADDLLLQADMLAELLYRGAAAERRELLALFDSLAASGPDAATRVLRALSALLFRAEHDVGQADELCDFFARHRDAAARTFDKDMIWRLLQAQATSAQRIGAVLLPDRSVTEFTVRQWARLGQHADVSVRRYAMNAYEAHEALIKQNSVEALRLLDTAWDDAREFGFNYFRTRYGESDWSPEYIVGICDSIRSDVQAFGRELLQRFFQQAQGPQYLATLSEHPSVNVQLFVSSFLEQHAAGHTDRILDLRHYFATVLSQINKARICKDRVLAFLLGESLRDAKVAALAAELFGELSLTVVRKDRSQLIKALIALRTAYPQLPTPIKPVAVRVRTGAAAAEIPSGV